MWDQQRPKRDAKFVECNLTMAALLDSHSNSSTITSTYAGEVADEYEANYITKERAGLNYMSKEGADLNYMTKEGAGLNYMSKEGAGLKYVTSMMLTAIDNIARYEANYMTKEGASFKCAASMMLTAIDNIARYPSVAPDTGSLQRTGTHLATHCQRFCEGGPNGHCS